MHPQPRWTRSCRRPLNETTSPDNSTTTDSTTSASFQRAVRQLHEPARIAALAYGLDLSPEQTIKVCATIDATPQHTMAIAIALRDGDGVAAFNDLLEGWPDVPGGWQQHAHPSSRATRTLVAVPDYNPTREIFDQWAGRTTAQATPSLEPEMP